MEIPQMFKWKCNSIRRKLKIPKYHLKIAGIFHSDHFSKYRCILNVDALLALPSRIGPHHADDELNSLYLLLIHNEFARCGISVSVKCLCIFPSFFLKTFSNKYAKCWNKYPGTSEFRLWLCKRWMKMEMQHFRLSILCLRFGLSHPLAIAIVCIFSIFNLFLPISFRKLYRSCAKYGRILKCIKRECHIRCDGLFAHFQKEKMLLRNRTIWLDAKLKCISILCTNFSFFEFFFSLVCFICHCTHTQTHIVSGLRIKFYYFQRSISGLCIVLHWVQIIKFRNMNPENIVHCICWSCQHQFCVLRAHNFNNPAQRQTKERTLTFRSNGFSRE